MRRPALGIMAVSASLIGSGCGEHAGSGEVALPRGEEYNVLLISMDTTRADHLGCYGHPSIRTPNIDRLAAEGTMFTQCMASAPLTLPSHASMLTGTHPYVHGVRDNGRFRLHEDNETLTEVLKAAGYATAAEAAAFVLNREYGLDQGFDVYNDAYAALNPEDIMRMSFTERDAEEVCNSALAWLRAHAEEPFFAFVHFFDPHQPHEPPERFGEQYGNPYVAEIAFVDEQIGRLLAELESLGVGDRTLVVLVADHGEGRGQHQELTHAIFVYDATMRVPLILRCPELIPAGRVVREQTQVIDVAPTVVDFLGIEPMRDAQGESLLPLVHGRGGASERLAYGESLYPMFNLGYAPLRMVRAEGWKYVHGPVPELYDLSDDPGELRDLASAEHQRLQELRGRLYELIENAPEVIDAADAERAMTPEEIEKLQALGYLGGSALPGHEIESELDLLEVAAPNPGDRIEVVHLTHLALGALQFGDLEEAEVLMREALEIPEVAEGNAWLQMSYGVVLALLGRLEEAIGHYEVAVRLEPTDGRTQLNLGLGLIKVGRGDEALVHLRRAVELEPVLGRANHDYAVAIAARGELVEAVRHFELAVAKHPNEPAWHADLADALFRTGKIGRAAAAFHRAVLLDPENQKYRRKLASLLLDLKRPHESRPHYEALVRMAPEDGKAHTGLGEVYRRLDEQDEAIAAFRRAIELDEKLEEAWEGLSYVLLQEGSHAEAIEVLQAALRVAPSHAGMTNNLAWLLATCPVDGLRDGEKAITLAEHATALTNGESCVQLDTLAVAYAAAGRFEEAVAAAERAIAIARESGQGDLVPEISGRLSLFKAGKPYRVP